MTHALACAFARSMSMDSSWFLRSSCLWASKSFFAMSSPILSFSYASQLLLWMIGSRRLPGFIGHAKMTWFISRARMTWFIRRARIEGFGRACIMAMCAHLFCEIAFSLCESVHKGCLELNCRVLPFLEAAWCLVNHSIYVLGILRATFVSQSRMTFAVSGNQVIVFLEIVFYRMQTVLSFQQTCKLILLFR